MAATSTNLLLLVVVVFFLACSSASAAARNETTAFRPGEQLRRYRRVQALLRRLNKPALRTIQARACSLSRIEFGFFVSVLCPSDSARLMAWLQSPDGDLIDCVAAHLQPAFDHPRLRGHRPLVIY